MLLDYESPAVGFHVDEERDLGGWTPTEHGEEEHAGDKGSIVAVMGDHLSGDGDVGRLGRKIEVFNWGDDVDLEGICAACGRPLIVMELETKLRFQGVEDV